MTPVLTQFDADDDTRVRLRAAQAAGPDRLREVRAEIVLEHLWLADRIARRFVNRGEDADDLIQIARTALLEAIQRYDPEQGPLVPFLHPSIAGVLKRHFRDQSWLVRPPRSTQQLSVRITQHWPRIAQERGCSPDDAQLAATLAEPIDRVREARQAGLGYRGVPLDTPTGFRDFAADDHDLDQSEAVLFIEQAWQVLTCAERQLLHLRYWEGRSQGDIAQRIGTSQMQVSRLLTKTLERIRIELAVDVVPVSAA